MAASGLNGDEKLLIVNTQSSALQASTVGERQRSSAAAAHVGGEKSAPTTLGRAWGECWHCCLRLAGLNHSLLPR